MWKVYRSKGPGKATESQALAETLLLVDAISTKTQSYAGSNRDFLVPRAATVIVASML